MTELEWRQNFSKQIRRKLVANGFDQRELAKRSNLSEVSISRYIQCRRSPKGTDILKIALALNCTVDELVNFGESIK